MNQNKAYKSLKYSIRQCGEDEIEIRNSFFDGYTRGFIRLLFIGIFCMSWYQNAKYKQPPFSYEIAAIKEDIIWTIYPEEKVKPLYEDYYKWVTKPETKNNYPNEKNRNIWRIYGLLHWKAQMEQDSLFFSTQFGWHFLLFLFCLPRPRGIRINRKKRIIYAPILNGTYRVAFVPKEGDPLGGVVYSCYGPQPFGRRKFILFCDGHSGREEYASLPPLF